MAVKRPQRSSRTQPALAATSASLQTILNDLKGLQQLHQFQSTLIQAAIKQVEQLDHK